MTQLFDVAVIGGGINGCGIAADAAMRGLSVILIEKDDIASKTSSSSTKLIHGGLRYLEYFNFSLVRKSLHERQILLNMAPHLVKPMPFVLPYKQSLRPSWILRIGLFLYDHLSPGNTLPRSQLVHRSMRAYYFLPLSNQFNKGFLFYDGVTDDARLTLANALQAKKHGALIYTRTELVGANIHHNTWDLQLKTKNGHEQSIHARTIINATGPWVQSINRLLAIPEHHTLSLVKGSHLVVPRLYDGDHAYLLQNDDKRIVFVIPFHGFSMIGTTEVLLADNLDKVTISNEEITYLFQLVSNYFKQTLTSASLITTWSGVRPLLADGDAEMRTMSRDYVFHFTEHPAPAIIIYGGKITTYRQLACEVVDKLQVVFPTLSPSITDKTPLPGAFLGNMNYQQYQTFALKQYRWLDKSVLTRLLSTYGTQTDTLLAGCQKKSELGYHFGHGLYEREVEYLILEEWATECNDILWRRTKLGLLFNSEELDKLSQYLINQSIKQETNPAPYCQ